MSRLIDADLIIAKIDGLEEEIKEKFGASFGSLVCDVSTKNWLNDAPTIDAVEVKHGEWVFSRGDGKTCVDGWTCSACGNSFHTNVPYFEEFHYCPNCGAKMDGEVKSDE